MTVPTQDLKFWQERLRVAAKPESAIAVGFDFKVIDPAHRKIIRRHCKPEWKYLDIGCGIGRTAKWFPKDQYVGVDFVPEFIDIAKQRHPDRVFQVVDLKEPLPFKDHEFDCGILISVKPVIGRCIGYDAWMKIEKEIMRVCKHALMFTYGDGDPFDFSTYEFL